MNATANGIATIARDYLSRGWRPIPIPPRTKAPKIDGWERLRIAESDLPNYFARDCNVGVLNGEPSGGLVDVDLDHPLARELADNFLPATGAEFGRKSSRRSHRLYVATSEVETLQKRLPKVDGKAKMIVELRSTGSQTVFPGSIHPEGEPVEWDADGEPAVVAPGLILAAVNALAAEVEKRLGVTRREPARNGHTGPATGDVGERARKYLAKVPPAVSGQGGHDQTFHAACVLVQGFALDRGPALDLLAEWNQSCEPPWAEWELEHKIDDALEKPGERGYLLNGDSGGGPSKPLQNSAKASRRPLTDLGNAERFASQHGDNVRYCHPWGKWLVWDGRRWAIDQCGEVIRRAKRTARSIYVEASAGADRKECEAVASWAAASERRERLNAMIALAESEQPIPIAVETLDSHPCLLNVANGAIDLRTGELREHRRDDCLTKLCNLEYPTEPGVDPDLWLAFLDRIFDGNARLIQFVQRLVGMALVGELFESVLPILYGSGCNGKSVFTETLCGMLGGDYAMFAGPDLLMLDRWGRHPTERADLAGKRLVALNETGDGNRLSETTVKQLTSRESIRTRRMREDSWEFRPSHTILLATNHRPEIRGTDYGIWRRIHMIPFGVTIPTEERDKQLASKLQAEWPAILRWAVAGCLAWQRDGLQSPAEVTEATDAYRAEQDVLGEWLAERCCLSADEESRASDLFGSYKRWAEARGEKGLTQTRFGVRLTERGLHKDRDAGNRVVYRGVGLLPEGSG